MAVVKVREDVLALAKALRHRDRFVRSHAAATLGGLGAEAAAATEELGRAVADKDPEIARRATRALGRIGARSMPHLCAALGHADAAVRREAVWALKDCGRAAFFALPALAAALRDADLRVCMGAAQAIGAIGPAAVDAVPALADALGGTNLILCRLAALALTRIGAASLPMLHQLLKQGDRITRREAAWAVRQIEISRTGSTSHSPADDEPRDSAATQIVDCVPASHARTALIP